MRRNRVLIAVVLVLALATGCVGVLPDERQDTTNATVTAVLDGDTVDVRLANGTDDRIRLLGIDTPEVHVENSPDYFDGVPDTPAARECLRAAGENASAFVSDRVDGQPIRLEFDETADRRGGYGRLLAYVHHDGTNLNRRLLERGYADVYPTTFRLRDRFEATARDARAADRGLWRCRDP